MTQLRIFITAILCTALLAPYGLHAEDLKASMWKVAASLNELQSYLYPEERFSNEKSTAEIQGILDSLERGFHQASQFSQQYRDEPGFVATLEVTRQLIRDANQRFKEGQKSYARWRLRNLPASCISCHTRYHVPEGGLAIAPSKEMPAAQQAEFLLATRQFEKAHSVYEKLLVVPSPQRREAMRLWLLIEVRVKQDPHSASAVLTKLISSGTLSAFEKELAEDWLLSLKRWEKDAVSGLPVLTNAERLLKTARELSMQEGEQRGTVELLRATAMLHAALDKGGLKTNADRQQALYLLGSAYAELSMRVIPEMPDMLLEQSIRIAPGTATAKRAYRALEQYTNRAFSGASGTDIPADVQLRLKELHDIAYGVPLPPSRV